MMLVATFNETSPLGLSCDVGLRSSSVTSRLPSISEPSLSLVLPSEPVDVVDDVESLPETFGFASAAALLHQPVTTVPSSMNDNSHASARQVCVSGDI